MNKLKIIIITIIILSLIFTIGHTLILGEEKYSFIDLPKGHWAEESIYKLYSLNITDGIGENTFGLGQTISKNEFAAFLVKLMKWDLVYPDKASFADNMDKSKWYYPYIETAIKHDAILADTEFFYGQQPITREEMAIMIVRALGYNRLSSRLEENYNVFKDVTKNVGFINIAKDFGIISGVGYNMFKPNNYAKREEAAAMIARMNERLEGKIDEIHGFYAIQSANQLDFIKDLDSVGFGWSRLEYDNEKVILNTTRENNNEFAIPSGFSNPINTAKESDTDTLLMVFAENAGSFNNEVPLLEYILTQSTVQKELIKSIAEHVNNTSTEDISISFDGVVIDFESLRGEGNKRRFTEFLTNLKKELDINKKKLYVAVHPAAKPGQAYFDGYDFRAIGNIADKIILMAHDYYAKELTSGEMENGYTLTPMTPIEDIYWALKFITDEEFGVIDREKILLQLSFDSVQWKVKNGKVINKYPYSPDYEAIKKRIQQDDVTVEYSQLYDNPYAKYYNREDETDNIIWYEDSRSINAKLKLAKMYGINGISIWRLGNVPNYKDTESRKIYLDIWNELK